MLRISEKYRIMVQYHYIEVDTEPHFAWIEYFKSIVRVVQLRLENPHYSPRTLER